MKKKKYLIIILLLIVIFGIYFYCKKNKEDSNVTIPVTIVGAVFGGENTDRISLDLNYNPNWITKNDNTIYNKNLSQFSAILCADQYFRKKDLEKNNYNRVECNNSDKEYDENLLFNELGFSDVKKYETFKHKDYQYDTDDSATFTIGYQNVNNLYDTFVVAFRGCFSMQERNSAIDIGFDNEEYYNINNKNAEWKNKNIFKGIDIAKNRSLEIINEYIKLHDRENIPNTILITGHSRGGSIASLIGAEYEKDDNMKSFTYTFCAPNYIISDEIENYNTIFNLVNENDFYSYYIDFQNENLYRIGKDIIFDINNNNKIKNIIFDLKKRNEYKCIDDNEKNNYKNLFYKRFPNRQSLYYKNNIKWEYITKEEAKIKYDFCKKAIGDEEGLGINKYCNLNDISINDSGKYEVKLDYYNFAILNCIMKTTVYGDLIYNVMNDLFTDSELGCELAKIVSKNVLEINQAHLIANLYAASMLYDE